MENQRHGNGYIGELLRELKEFQDVVRAKGKLFGCLMYIASTLKA